MKEAYLRSLPAFATVGQGWAIHWRECTRSRALDNGGGCDGRKMLQSDNRGTGETGALSSACSAMKVLAADEYIPCCALLRTLTLLYDVVCVTSANSIDEVRHIRLS